MPKAVFSQTLFVAYLVMDIQWSREKPKDIGFNNGCQCTIPRSLVL